MYIAITIYFCAYKYKNPYTDGQIPNVTPTLYTYFSSSLELKCEGIPSVYLSFTFSMFNSNENYWQSKV